MKNAKHYLEAIKFVAESAKFIPVNMHLRRLTMMTKSDTGFQ